MSDETLYDSKFYLGDDEITFDEDVTEKISHDITTSGDAVKEK